MSPIKPRSQLNASEQDYDAIDLLCIAAAREIQETETVTDPDWDRHMRMINSESAEEEGILAPNKWQQFLSKYTRQPFRPATSAAGGYSAAQLNQMNALGGYYSEPARGRRRWEKRQTNILKVI